MCTRSSALSAWFRLMGYIERAARTNRTRLTRQTLCSLLALSSVGNECRGNQTYLDGCTDRRSYAGLGADAQCEQATAESSRLLIMRTGRGTYEPQDTAARLD